MDDPNTLALTIAGLISLAMLWSFEKHEAFCVQCRGKGKHRKDCPFDKDAE